MSQLQLRVSRYTVQLSFCRRATLTSPITEDRKHSNVNSSEIFGSLFATVFCAPFFKEIHSFFCVVTPSKTLAALQPLNIAFPLGNGGVLRSQAGGGGVRKEGDGGEGTKRREKGRALGAQSNMPLKGFCFHGQALGFF